MRATVTQRGIIYLHSDDIAGTRLQIRSHIHIKRRAPAKMSPGIMPVYPDLGIHVYAFKVKEHPVTVIPRIIFKIAPVPTDGSRRTTGIIAKVTLNAPIMRQINPAP